MKKAILNRPKGIHSPFTRNDRIRMAAHYVNGYFGGLGGYISAPPKNEIVKRRKEIRKRRLVKKMRRG